MGVFNEFSPLLAELGYDPIPLAPGCKHPRIKEWQTRKFEPSQQFAGCGIGHRTHTIGALDVDVTDARIANKVWTVLEREYGLSNRRVGKAPKWASLVWNEYGTKLSQSFGEHKIELLGDGQQLAMYHIHPDTGQPYEWTQGDPLSGSELELPVLTRDDALGLIEFIASETKLEPTGEVRGGAKPGAFRDWEDKRGVHVSTKGLREDAVAAKLKERGLIIKDKNNGKYEIECPWGLEHSSGRRDGAVYYSPAGTYMPKFICLHETCRSNNRNYEELVKWLGFGDYL